MLTLAGCQWLEPAPCSGTMTKTTDEAAWFPTLGGAEAVRSAARAKLVYARVRGYPAWPVSPRD